MKYMVIERFGDLINVIHDKKGEVLQFTDLAEAQRVSTTVQNGLVLPLTNIFPILQELSTRLNSDSLYDQELLCQIEDIISH